MSRKKLELLTSLNRAPQQTRSYGGKSHLLPSGLLQEYFPQDRLTDRLIRQLVHGHVIRWKEILESFEFFGLARKYVRRESIADVCCGHGLTGVLFVTD